MVRLSFGAIQRFGFERAPRSGELNFNKFLSRHCRSIRFFSSEEPPEQFTDEQQINEEKKEKIAVIFPWRHEETPLPRLVEGTEEFESQGQLLSTVTNQTGNPQMNMLASAFMFLDVPLYQFLFFGSWKGELADSMSWAFTQGVAGLLSSLSSKAAKPIPMDKIINDTYDLSFHTVVGKVIGSVPAGADEETAAAEQVPEVSVPLDNMLEKKLIDLYAGAKDSIAAETEVCLKTYPHTTELVSLYCIPYISRQNIENDKALLSFYRDMMAKPSLDRTNDLNKLRKDKLEKGIMESTVIAQVLVWCNEVFFVKDIESGKVIQGSDENETPRNVCHLLRMESRVRTTKDPQGTFKNIQEDWIITDIDDVLGGNLIV